MANLKRNMIELVTAVVKGENEEEEKVETKKYLTPVFIPLSVVYEAMDMMDTMIKAENTTDVSTEREMIDTMLDFVATKVYGNQFTKDDLINGLHAPDAIQTLQDQVIFVAQGQQTNETKKFLEKKS